MVILNSSGPLVFTLTRHHVQGLWPSNGWFDNNNNKSQSHVGLLRITSATSSYTLHRAWGWGGLVGTSLVFCSVLMVNMGMVGWVYLLAKFVLSGFFP